MAIHLESEVLQSTLKCFFRRVTIDIAIAIAPEGKGEGPEALNNLLGPSVGFCMDLSCREGLGICLYPKFTETAPEEVYPANCRLICLSDKAVYRAQRNQQWGLAGDSGRQSARL